MIERNVKLQTILYQIREEVCLHDTDIIFSKYENIEQLVEEIDKIIQRLEQNEQSVYKDIEFLFAPTGSLQDISITNGWGEKFIDLSSMVDKLIIMNYEEIKCKLSNVYFVNGTAYAGKSTIVKMISDRLGLYFCGENYNLDKVLAKVTPEECPNLCYFKTMKSWDEFVSRTPEEYDAWISGGQVETTPFEIEDLIELSKSQKVIVDTNIPVDILQKISDYDHVAILLSPQCMSINEFFNRKDPDKLFILEQIMKTRNPEITLENYKKCIEKVNSLEHYNEFLNSGFKCFIREENSNLEGRYSQIIKHFKLI